jgi:hypothetical protein
MGGMRMRRFTDPEIVFHYEGTGGGMEQTLEADEDCTLIYDESPNYYAYLGGEKGKVERLSPAEPRRGFQVTMRRTIVLSPI